MHTQRRTGCLLLHLRYDRRTKGCAAPARYPIGHRVTAEHWIGLQEGDLFWSTSATGWAKAAWSVLFGPWELGVATFMYGGRFDPRRHLGSQSNKLGRVNKLDAGS